MLGWVTRVPEDTIPLLLFPEWVSIRWPCPSKVPFLCSIVATQKMAGASWADQVMTIKESQNALRDAGCSRWELWGMVTQQGADTAVLVSQAPVLTHSPRIYGTLRWLQQNVISLNHMLYIHRLSCWRKHALFLPQRPLNEVGKWACRAADCIFTGVKAFPETTSPPHPHPPSAAVCLLLSMMPFA